MSDPPRRYSVGQKDYDPDLARRLHISVDGVEQDDVISYDCDAGTVLKYKLDADGKPFPEPPEGEGKQCRLIERLHPDDGRVLVCKLPDGHDWVIDSRCNNCTLPLDDVHWCWNRSGRPEDGTLDVRKGKPGQTTCSAGAGSIQTGRWHGFLHNGRLTNC